MTCPFSNGSNRQNLCDEVLVRDGRGGRLRVAAGSYIHDIAVQPAAIELINANPSIGLELLEREWVAVTAMLMTDRIDFAVFDTASVRGMPALRIEPLGALSGVYFCRSGHPLLKKAQLQPADLRAYPFILPSLSHLHAGLIEGLDAGLTLDAITGDAQPSIAVLSFRASRQIAAETDGLSIGYLSEISSEIAAGRLAVLRLPWRTKPPTAEMGIAYKRERTLPPAARTFIGLIRKKMRRLVASLK
jgi:DNA-binding transcriptional LysR family regulator